jgi:hypothetical protein
MRKSGYYIVKLKGYSREVMEFDDMGGNFGGWYRAGNDCRYKNDDSQFEYISPEPLDLSQDWKSKYEKAINVIRRFDAGIIGMYDL